MEKRGKKKTVRAVLFYKAIDVLIFHHEISTVSCKGFQRSRVIQEIIDEKSFFAYRCRSLSVVRRAKVNVQQRAFGQGKR